MPVTVDQSGHDDLAPGVDHVAARKSFGEITRRADGDDAVATDCHGTVFQDTSR